MMDNYTAGIFKAMMKLLRKLKLRFHRCKPMPDKYVPTVRIRGGMGGDIEYRWYPCRICGKPMDIIRMCESMKFVGCSDKYLDYEAFNNE